MACVIHGKACSSALHSPGGEVTGTHPFRPGKTHRDKVVTGSWGNRFANRANDPGRNPQ